MTLQTLLAIEGLIFRKNKSHHRHQRGHLPLPSAKKKHYEHIIFWLRQKITLIQPHHLISYLWHVSTPRQCIYLAYTKSKVRIRFTMVRFQVFSWPRYVISRFYVSVRKNHIIITTITFDSSLFALFVM